MALIMIRLGEITLKSRRTRPRFERILIHNIRDALKSNQIESFKIIREWGRFYVEVEDELADKAIEILSRVFGIKSLSPVYKISYEDFEDLINQAFNFFVDKVKDKVFAVRARRTGVSEFTSLDVERELGKRLLKFSRGVDLENPSIIVYVEVRGKNAYLFTKIYKAYGGLPIGSEGKALALVSGGFDSAVAAWFMMKRGIMVDFLFCNLDGEAHQAGVISVVKVLVDKWCYGYRPKLIIVNFQDILFEILNKCENKYLNIILKRMMYRVAKMILPKVNAEAIITGESMGQVSSQTLRNLVVSSNAVDVSIFRPLIGFDKDEIIEYSRIIGTYEASARVKEYCGAFSDKPVTRANLDDIVREESKFDFSLLERAVKELKVIDLRKLSQIISFKELEIEDIPDGAIIIDVRSPEKYKRSHIDGAINIDFMRLFEEINKLKKNKTIVLYCDEGALSLEAARILKEKGFNVFSLKGGYRRIKRKLSRNLSSSNIF